MTIYRRLLLTLCIFLAVVLIGATGLKLFAGARYSFPECAYNAFVFVSTVDRPFGGALEETCGVGYRIFTAFLIVGGMGTILYGVSTITAFIVEGELTDALRRRRMEKRIKRLRNHIIVCGVGETGFYIAEELHKIRSPFVVVENSEHQLERLKTMGDVLYIMGDATDDEVLEKAGIMHAAGIILVLPSDKENLFATVTARQLNPGIKIITKGIDPKTDIKFIRAGADRVISPAAIGGLRMVSEMVRPSVVTFLDKMLRDPQETTRIEEITVAEGSDLADKTLEQARIGQRAGVQVLAIREPHEQRFTYRPAPETRLLSGTVMVIIGEVGSVQKARALAGTAEQPPAEPETSS